MDSPEPITEQSGIAFPARAAGGPGAPVRNRRPFFAAALLALPVLAAACSDSTGPGGVPARIEIVQGNQQESTVGAELPEALVVKVRDGRGRALPDVTVSWSVRSGQGTVQPGTTTTDSDGQAQAQWSLGTTAGNQEVAASVEGIEGAVFRADAWAGPAAAMEALVGDEQQAEVGRNLPDPLVVRVVDAHGNAVSGTQVLWSAQVGDGTLNPLSSVTDANGHATTSWTLGTLIGEQRALATTGTASYSFRATAFSDDFNIFVASVHLNQGSQTSDGAIGGIARRPGILRIVVRATAGNTYSPDVIVQLHGGDRGLIREVTIPAPRSGVPVDPDMTVEHDTWNLKLTADDVISDLRVVATLDPDETIPVTSRDDNRYPRLGGLASLDVRSLPPLNIVFIPIQATAQSLTGAINAGNVNDFLRATRQWIPSGAISATVREPFTTDRDLTQSQAWSQLLGDILAVRTAEGATDEYYHGIVPTFQGIPLGGIAYVPPDPNHHARAALSYDHAQVGHEVVAHELGHNLGRRHAPCGGPSGVDPDFPHLDGGIGHMGYDILSSQLRHPSSHKDYMSYCRPSWTSDYTYAGILEWRRADQLAAGYEPVAAGAGATAYSAAGSGPAARAATTGLLLWGAVSSAGVQLNPAVSITAPPSLPETGGPYALRGIGADGSEIFRLSFRPTRVAHGSDPEEAHFAFFVPLSPDQIERVSRVEVTGPRGRSVRQSRGPARADARLEAAPGGDLRVRWHADDYPLALVRDAVTGRVLSIARGGDARFTGESRRPADVQVLLSDGVRTREARIQ